MAEFPSLPLWVQRYMADTDHLSNEEHGIYLRILMVMWIAPFQRLPNDDNWLSRRFHTPAEKLRPIISEFCQCDGNWITQKCLAKEWIKVEVISRKRREAAKLRWELDKDPFKCNAGVHKPSNAPTPTPTPTPTEVSKKERKISANILLPETWEPSELHFSVGIKKGLTREEVIDFASEMRCWSEGNGEKRRNWDAVFTNWLRRATRRSYRNGGGTSRAAATRSAIYETLDRAIEATGGHKLRGKEGEGANGSGSLVGKSGPEPLSAWPSGSPLALPKAGD